MMKYIYTTILFTLLFGLSYSQAKKPTLMVLPSDRYCIENGYFIEFEQYGELKKLPDYKKLLQGDEKMRLIISQMAAIMVERGFPLKDLELELKRLEQERIELSLVTGTEGGEIVENPIEALKRTAKADILLDLDFSIQSAKLGMNYANFNLKGLDAYTGKIIASASGSGKPFMTEQVEILLQMAVKDHMDNFNALLNDFFEDMFNNGREISVKIKMFDSSPYSFYDEFTYDPYDMTDELSYIIEEFFNETTVNQRFTVDDITETSMSFSQVRIPLFNERNRAVDARTYIRTLHKILKKAPFNVDSNIYIRGLGEVWLIIGEK